MPGGDPYEIVVGLEVHAQLQTKTKLFCADSAEFGKEPNTQISAISLGYPGTLPMMNREIIPLALRLGIACNCSITRENYFARKNYFYADLPKGYQVSQHTTPVCTNGFLSIVTEKGQKKIRINRIHIEEDAGKSMHDEGEDSNLDFNRAGMPLLEIVTEPDIRSADEAFAYVTSLRKLVRHLDVCDGNMEEGSLRCDVNISVRKTGDEKLGTRVEIKNLNSIRFIKKAIAYESGRLIDLHRKNEKILQQTRGYDESSGKTYTIRTKENEEDYRYFPEPDLPPFLITDEEIESVRNKMPPLQEKIKEQLEHDFALQVNSATILAEDSDLAHLFFATAGYCQNSKALANWITGPVKNYLGSNDISWEETSVPPQQLAVLIGLVETGKINYGIASQRILPQLMKNPEMDLIRHISEEGLEIQSSSGEVDALIDAALQKHAQKIPEYKKGKKGLISVFVGEVMKLSNGKADAKTVTQKLIEKLNA